MAPNLFHILFLNFAKSVIQTLWQAGENAVMVAMVIIGDKIINNFFTNNCAN